MANNNFNHKPYLKLQVKYRILHKIYQESISFTGWNIENGKIIVESVHIHW